MTVIKDTGTRAVLPPFGEEHEELRETVNRFVAKEIAPNVDEWEAAREFPRELYGRCAELGFLGLKFPESYGGQGGTHLHDAIWVEELARSGGSGGVAAGLNAHTSIAMPPIFNFGAAEQKQRWLAPGIAGEKIGALGITEPHSRLRRGRHLHLRQEGRRRLRRQRLRRPSSPTACAPTSSSARWKTTQDGGHHGISFLVLEREMPGYEVARKLEKISWRYLRHGRAGLHRRRGARGEPARRGKRGLQADHGQLRLGASADGDRRRRRDAAPDRRPRSPSPSSAKPSAARSASSRRSATT